MSIIEKPVSRRTALLTGAAAMSTIAVPRISAADRVRAADSSKRRAARIAHLSDIHVQPERNAGRGMVAALQHVHSLDDRPDLVITGGDAIMDGYSASRERTRIQWQMWNRILQKECSLPVKHCLGNHDVWGWDKRRSGATGDEADWGKAWALAELKLERTYYSFDLAGWRVIVLDSVHAAGEGYLARLDERQFRWLTVELGNVGRGTPVLIVSHIPILSVAAFFDGETERIDHWHIPTQWVHHDARRLKDLFLRHENVRLCLSGHLHLVDRVLYNGVTYICDGAVCGNWWRGNHQECDEGYGLIDLYADGTFDHQYIAYGWSVG